MRRSPELNQFGPVAQVYDLLMRSVPYDAWAEYYRLLLATVGSDPHTLLDVCCGTGTLALLLANDSVQVTGFDLSEGMVQAARAKPAEGHAEFFVADACSFSLDKTFEGAYSFFDSLNYIASLEGLLSAFERVGAHLVPGAWFIFDLNTEYAFQQRMFDQRDRRANSPVKYLWKGDYDPATRIIEVEMKFEHEGHEFSETHVQRAHRLEEVATGLSQAGFGRLRVFDSYTLDGPNKRSDRIHVAACRNG